MKKTFLFFIKHKKIILIGTLISFFILLLLPICTIRTMKINSPYTQKEDVALYLMQYHELPPNYITHYGYKYMRDNKIPFDNYIIGGDTHYNDGKLCENGISKETQLKECDIINNDYSLNKSRGKLRLVYTCNTNNIRVFYTTDHYNSYEELSKFKLQLTSNVFWIIFGIYCFVASVFYCFVIVGKKQSSK